MVYNTYGRYSMYIYYIVYCQEIAHYSLKKIKNRAAVYIKHMLGVVALSAPESEISRSLSLMAV